MNTELLEQIVFTPWDTETLIYHKRINFCKLDSCDVSSLCEDKYLCFQASLRLIVSVTYELRNYFGN